MTERAVEQLAAIQTLVESAKSVPMSASCMVNRAELLGLLRDASETVAHDLEEARRGSGAETVAAALATSEQLVADAKERAEELLTEDAVHQLAVERADELTRTTQEETEALKREADAYVDQRMAALEAVMSKTLAQVKTMRARLSERSGLDDQLPG